MNFSDKRKYGVIFGIFLLLVVSFNTSLAYGQNTSSKFYEPETEALTTFANGIAGAAPKIIAAGILLLIGFVVGKVVDRIIVKATKKILQKTNLQIASNSGIVEHTVGQFDSAHLIAATVKWFVYLFFVVAAINTLHLEQLTTALTSLWLWIPNLLAFVLVVIVGSIIANYLTKWVNHELVVHHYGGSRYINIGIKAVTYSIVFAVGLTQIGIGQSVIPTLVSAFSWSIAVAIGAAIAVGLGFTLKDVLPVAIAGAANHQSFLKIGQYVKIGEVTGVITAAEMMHIIVTNENNESVVIPTKVLMSKNITIIHTASDTKKVSIFA